VSSGDQLQAALSDHRVFFVLLTANTNDQNLITLDPAVWPPSDDWSLGINITRSVVVRCGRVPL
jgi:hypothetical protein